jgi:hypothetical protein
LFTKRENEREIVMKKNCKYCGKEYEPQHHNSKYCEECRVLGKDILTGKVRDNRKPQICEYCGKEYVHNRKTRLCSDECMKQAALDKAKASRVDVRKIQCASCGKEFTPTHGKLYCSYECKSKAKSKRSKGRKRNKQLMKYTYACKYCGKVFHPKSKERQYCCKSCSVKDRRKDKPIKQAKQKPVCIICGNEFEGNPCAKYCSDECRKERAKRRAFETCKTKHEAKIKPRECKECGRMFTPGYGAKKRLFCSETCSKRHASRIGKATRRARKRGNVYEFINPFEIFKRDQWTCQLCGAKTPRKLRGTLEDRAPELDHIIPLAKGGEHSRKNVQCTCRKCNQQKGDSILGQLRLC